MLWLLLSVGVLTAAVAFPRVGKTIIRLFAVLIALLVLMPLALIVTFQRLRLRRRRRNAGKIQAVGAATGRVDRDESPPLGRAIPSP
jgi:hypothetical protein